MREHNFLFRGRVPPGRAFRYIRLVGGMPLQSLTRRTDPLCSSLSLFQEAGALFSSYTFRLPSVINTTPPITIRQAVNA